jgi:hypothetical protein
MGADRKRELKRAFQDREQEVARQAMLLDEDQLEELLGYLDERLPDAGCDHSLQLTRRWAGQNGVDADALASSLEQFGGFCDCEVLANVDPEAIF